MCSTLSLQLKACIFSGGRVQLRERIVSNLFIDLTQLIIDDTQSVCGHSVFLLSLILLLYYYYSTALFEQPTSSNIIIMKL